MSEDKVHDYTIDKLLKEQATLLEEKNKLGNDLIEEVACAANLKDQLVKLNHAYLAVLGDKDRLQARLDERARIAVNAIQERDAWKAVARKTGICMSCAINSVEPCTDCLGTGWNNGEDPWARINELESEKAKLLAHWTEDGCPSKAPHPLVTAEKGKS
jgi:hypothetical protein